MTSWHEQPLMAVLLLLLLSTPWQVKSVMSMICWKPMT